MMTPQWLRAVLVGLIAAEAVALVAAGPRWRAAVGPDVTPLAFSPDGDTVYAFAADPPTLQAWDARAGRVRTTPLDGLPKRFAAYAVGGRLAVVVDPAGDDHRWWVFDLATGTRVAGPLADMPRLNDPAVTADGRWLIDDAARGVTVRAIPGGAIAARLDDRPGGRVDGVAAGDRGSRVALLWRPTGEACVVELTDLPGGRPVKRFVLPPPHGVWWVTALHGDRVTLTDHDYTAVGPDVLVEVDFAADPPTCRRVFAVAPATQGEPYRRVRVGADWFAVVSPSGRFSKLEDAWVWVCFQLDMLDAVPTATVGTVTVFHADGRPRGAIKVRAATVVRLSPDGRAVATVDGQQRLVVWDIDPPAAWPRAVAAGVLAFAAWLAWERRRARRAAQ